MTKQELIQAAKEIREICCNAGETNTWDDWSVKAMTNRDKFLLKLIDMSDRELANIYCISVNDCRDCRYVGVKGCFDKIVDWMKQERESNDS